MKAYFIRRLGQPLVLSDLPSLELGGEVSLDLYASAPLCDTDRRFASLCLRKEAENAVRLWIQNKRYFPRLIISATIFLLAYILASFLIRDPLPMVDELLIAFAASAAAWALLARNDAEASVAKEKERKLSAVIESAPVLLKEDLRELEERYQALFCYDIMALAGKLVSNTLGHIECPDDIREAARIYLTAHDKTMLKDIKDLRDAKDRERLKNNLVHLASTANIDLYATAFFFLLLN